MTKEGEREVQRKLRVLQHAEKIGHVARACRYFGIARLASKDWLPPALVVETLLEVQKLEKAA
ncbi:RNA methyltransferase [Parasphingorhabdus halotolerans]|uniref:RNA methyltransferase n=1 Tax=Parasphingorhabdus halotolerans TaxID=2725558 RepID=A0A6H2DRX7_9SPHN|nr:RNA methyltransferase [Parasphingorhabdus halotolerans]QJB70511.1 RNA methyltransferase [Parasphingorhabdus halotolerans]